MDEQNEFGVPLDKNQRRKSERFIPRFFRSDSNKKFLAGTMDPLIQRGTAKRLNGYIGRKNSKATLADDVFIEEVLKDREDYQLEPSLVQEDNLGNIDFYKDYIDYINSIKVNGGIVDNHQRLNVQEFYSWNPHIDWDKFSNYLQYYWLPYGPDTVSVFGNKTLDIISTYKVILTDEGDNLAYLFTPNGLDRNPDLRLYRGETYRFEIDAETQPLTIKTERVGGTSPEFKGSQEFTYEQNGENNFVIEILAESDLIEDLLINVYIDGNKLNTEQFLFYKNDKEKYVLLIENDILAGQKVIVDFFNLKENDQYRYMNGIKIYEQVNDKLILTNKFSVKKGVLEFTVSANAPDQLYYVSENDPNTSGIIRIFDILENTLIDVDNEIIGKKNYTSNNLSLSNGMKIKFKGIVDPVFYRNKEFYVEGVGESIQLIDVKTLEVVTDLAYNVDVNFDTGGYDQLAFNNINYAALDKDYIVINRSSRDRNPWSRYNRWFHKDVIEKTAKILGVVPTFDQNQRAIRPIIEFKPNLRLYNFGNRSKKNIDLVDDFTKDVFSIIEGSLGYIVDGVELFNGHRIIFTADNDIRVKNKIYLVEFLNIYEEDTGITKRRIHLAEEPDTEPLLDETILVLAGKEYGGKMVWFNGTTWTVGQTKTKLNQTPLYNLVDEESVYLDDQSKYDGSTFKGTKLFSYREGTANIDKELGFSLTYKNINNIGDIVFDFNLSIDTFKYKLLNKVVTEKVDNKYLQILNIDNTTSLVNGWIVNRLENTQPIVRIYKNEFDLIGNKNVKIINNFPLDVFDDKENLEDLRVKVYINSKKLNQQEYEIFDGIIFKHVRLEKDLKDNEVLTIKCYTKKSKNDKGYYEFPLNFQNNPLNENIESFTLGEVLDHVNSIIDNLDDFDGIYPGSSNLRDIGDLTSKGTKFIQHSGSLNLSLMHLANKNYNIFKALDQAMNDYNLFKRAFVYNTEYLEEGLTAKEAVDYLLDQINKNKTKDMPYYFSDMLAYKGSTRTQFKIKEFVQRFFPLVRLFNLKESSPNATYIYLNFKQLLHEKDYIFTGDGFVEILVKLKENDILDIYEYESTDGSYVPPTPTSLGLYPKYEPKKYLDTTLLTPKNVIQGHDGSVVLAFDDFRDDIILEIENRIFNNIKINYDPKVLDIYDYISGSNRKNLYSREEYNHVLAPSFFKWTSLVDKDYTKSNIYLNSNPFTYNYSEVQSFDFTTLPGYWRGIYCWYFDTDRIHIAPWESLGLSIKPKWWEEVYGIEPYTSDNYVLWNDLRDGIIREPGKPVKVLDKFVKPILNNIPVNDGGVLLDPIAASVATGLFNARTEKNFVFGDVSPVENAWRRSSYYPFSIIKQLILLTPNRVFSVYYDRFRQTRNLANQLVYKDTGLRIRLKDIKVSNSINDLERVQTAGLINYVVDYLTSSKYSRLTDYKNSLQRLTNKLSHRLAGYTSEEKFNLILDSRNVNSTSTVFIPKENYQIFLNTSSPTNRLFYSGVIITKMYTRYGLGYEIKGYSQSQPYFLYHPSKNSGIDINIGGVSESYINYDSNQQYIVGNIVKIQNSYYRVKITHTSGTNPNYDYLQKLGNLPIIGGVNAIFRNEFETTLLTLNYGTIVYTVQDVVDFLLGYGKYLENQGFEFNSYISELRLVGNWETSAKEFMFWVTQNWSAGNDIYYEWEPLTSFRANDTVYYNNNFYNVRENHTTSLIFDPELYYPIDDIDTTGASAISLSPAALGVTLNLKYNVVENILDSLEYEIFRADAQKYNSNDLNYYREENKFIIKPKNQDIGIYGLALYLTQKEHVLLIDNITQFNDIIYNIPTGYRQERIKVYGYKTIEWNGSFDTPGFVYDSARIQEWQPWIDYNLGDIVKEKEFYYAASKNVSASQNFDNTEWVKLNEEPKSALLPNWDYNSLQFLDFYDLDSDNFDINQQSIAQHLIGYQKRQYLSNIIKNDVSEFKFYQGMITEKGTTNSLNKLFDVLGPSNESGLEFNEEWAVRIARYGASEIFEEVEFIIDESKFKLEPQPFELVTEVDPNKRDFVIRQTKNEIYLKPRDFSIDIWPKNDNVNDLLKTPGFCKIEYAKLVLNDLDDILTEQAEGRLSINDLVPGDYIWCGFQKKINRFEDDWNIFRYNKLYVSVTNIIDGTELQIVLNRWPNLQAGDIICITSSYERLNQFVKITEIPSDPNTFIIAKPSGFQLNQISNDLDSIVLFNINENRLKNIDEFETPKYAYSETDYEIPKYINPENINWPYGELVWISDTKNKIIKNTKVYNQTAITNFTTKLNQEFGYRVAVNKDATLMTVLSRNNEIWKEAWTANTLYLKDNVVAYNNKFWNCLKTEVNASTFFATRTLENVLINDRDGDSTTPPVFSCTSTQYMVVGSQVQILGVFSNNISNGNIVDHVEQKIYKISQVDNTYNTFVLVNLDNSPLELEEGATIGLSFVLLGDWVETNLSSRELTIFIKPYLSTQWAKKQVIIPPTNVFDFGDVISISDDARFIAVSGVTSQSNNLVRQIYLYSIPQKTIKFNTGPNLISGARLDFNNNKIIIENHYLADGTLIKYSTSDTSVKGLDNNEEYYVKVLDSDSFRLTRDVDLQDVITLSKSSTGSHYITNLKLNQDFILDYVIYNPTGYDYNFGSKIKFSLNLDPTDPSLTLYKIYVRSYQQGLFVFDYQDSSSFTLIDPHSPYTTYSFVYDFDVNSDGTYIALSAPDQGAVFIYNQSLNLVQTLSANPSNKFGVSVSLSSNGSYLGIGSSLEDDDFTDQGKVRIYKYSKDWLSNTLYYKDDFVFVSVSNKIYKILETHTSSLSFNNNDNKYEDILISNASSNRFVEFQTIENRNAEINEQFGYFIKFANDDDTDNMPKTLVIGSLKGDALSFDQYGDSSVTLISETNKILDIGRIDIYDRYETKFIFSEALPVSNTVLSTPLSMDISTNSIVIGDPSFIQNNTKTGKIYLHTKKANTYSWQTFIEEKDKVKIDWFKKIFLYDKTKDSLITYLDIIDPVQGKIAGIAEQELKFKTYYDPATYSFKSSVYTANLSIDPGMAWTDKHVGMLWWDLRQAKFLDSTIGDTVYNNSVWNTLFPTASINIYEWVESSVPPDEWDELADTNEGFADGISGTSLYGSNVYSVKNTYDSRSGKVISTYYFWVKNKVITPTVKERKFSARDIANLIENPKNYNLKYIKFLSLNAFGLANVKSLLDKKNIVLSIQYWKYDPKNLQIHGEWKIISNNEKTSIPPLIERKWFDSLIGNDENGKSLPDFTLSPKIRYGSEFRPNQSMFINRLEAIKILIDQLNRELKPLQVENIDLTDLYIKDEAPDIKLGTYDYVVDIYDELRFILPQTHNIAILNPTIKNGKIINVQIVSKGLGYKNAPRLTVQGSGFNADIRTIIDANGSISSVNILDSGYGYTDQTELIIRPLSVLVLSDKFTLNDWAIYHYENNEWIKKRTKQFDVTNYWHFIDWFEEGYNQFTKIDYVVKGYNELLNLQAEIGSIVKIQTTNGTNDWDIAIKISDEIAVDYTKIYKVVGRKNGAIQISSSFYDFGINDQGYDGLLYDSNPYDKNGTVELRILLNALKNKILIDIRRKIYINLFFSSLKYILNEQPFVDWFFKTSFVKVLHNVGSLRQKINFNNDNLEDYEKYIYEVKPYRTKIREFVSIYDNIDNSDSLISDFDLPAFVTQENNIRVIYSQLQDNNVYVSYSNLMSEYPWKAWRDNLGFGVKEILIKDSGDGYLDYPNIKIEGYCTRPAKIKVFISKAKIVRVDVLDSGEGYFIPPKITLEGKFKEDGYEAKVFAVLGNNPIRTNLIGMKFDRYLKESINTVQDITVTEDFIGDGSTKIFDLRYSPEIKRDLLMIKINNVEVFSNEYIVEKRTSISKGYKVYYGILSFNSAPNIGDIVNITYQKDFNNLNALERIKHFYDPKDGMLGLEFDQLMTGIDYGGVTVTGIGFNKINLWDAEYDTGEYSWSSAGWDSGEPTDDELFDTIIDGGNLPKLNPAFRTANGIRADDIIIDGDNFITPMTSPAPEEMLPGHVADTLAIKVFERNISVSSEINCNRFLTDGVTNAYYLNSYPNNDKAILVKINDQLLTSDQYLFEYNDLRVILLETPPPGKELSILSFGFNGKNLLVIDQLVVTEEGDSVVLDADWQENISVFTVVAGIPTKNEPFKTSGAYQSNVPYKLDDTVVYENKLYQSVKKNNFNNTPLIYSLEARDYVVNTEWWNKIEDGVQAYTKIDKIGVKLPVSVSIGDIIVYSVFIGDTTDQSILTKEIITSDGTTLEYRLDNFIGNSFPLALNTIVRVGNTILNSIDQFKFTLKNRQTRYTMPLNKSNLDVYSSTDYLVYINGVLVPDAIAYTLNLLDGNITIKPNYYKENAEVLVAITKFTEYDIDNDLGYSRIKFRLPFPQGTKIEVIGMTNHDVLNLNRTYLTIEKDLYLKTDNIYYPLLIEASGGVFYLEQEILNSNYVWVTKNKELLVPGSDYTLREDKRSIQLTVTPNEEDIVGIITFGSNIVRNPVKFLQFKDMLNNYSYKRLSDNRTTRLARNLYPNDKEILVENSSRITDGFRDSNIPGVLYINGERIEYYVRIGNSVSELRRGTRGTGVPSVHALGTEVFDIGVAQDIPYQDTISIYKILGNWEPSIRYLNNDVVTYNNQNWIAITGINYDLWNNTKTYKLNETLIVQYLIKGNWNINNDYNVNDIVYYTNSNTGDVESWLMLTGIDWKPWNFNITYKKDDVVIRNNKLYKSIKTQENYSNDPLAILVTGELYNTEWWVLVENTVTQYPSDKNNNWALVDIPSYPTNTILNKLYVSSKENDNGDTNKAKNPLVETSWWALEDNDVTQYPSSTNRNWARTDIAYIENDSTNTLVIPWIPITKTESTTNLFDKPVMDTEIFIGTKRLNKLDYKLHNRDIHPHSPEGDESFFNDFITDGINHGASNNKVLAYIRLSEDPGNNRITVIRKQGTIWNDLGKTLSESANKVAEFLKISVSELEGTQATFDSRSYRSDSENLKMDKE